MTWADLAPLAVELVLLLGTLSLLGVDLLLPHGEKRVLSWGALGVITAAFVGTWALPWDGAALGGVFVRDGLTVYFERLFLMAGILAVVASHHLGQREWPRRQGEYVQLVLFSVLGMMLLGGVRDLILLAVAFELMGIPLYVLAGWRRRDAHGAEAALKLYLVGAASSAITLYGMSILFGLSGTTYLPEIARTVASDASPLLVMGVGATIAGMGYKIGVVPFHMWVPDTYQGAPTPFVAFLSVGPKAAGMVALVQVLLPASGALLGVVVELLLVLSAVSIVLATLMAIPQENIKRLLGYSGIAHMGFLLMALATGEVLGLTTLLFYLMGYLFTSVGAFLVVHVVRQAGGDDTLASFDGLGRRSYFLGMSMLLFLLSLAGIPFVVGFWAKIYVFMAAWRAGFEWLVILGAVVSVVGLFYYLRVARAVFMNPPRDDSTVPMDLASFVGIAACLIAVMAMGLYPTPFFAAARSAAEAFLGM